MLLQQMLTKVALGLLMTTGAPDQRPHQFPNVKASSRIGGSSNRPLITPASYKVLSQSALSTQDLDFTTGLAEFRELPSMLHAHVRRLGLEHLKKRREAVARWTASQDVRPRAYAGVFGRTLPRAHAAQPARHRCH